MQLEQLDYHRFELMLSDNEVEEFEAAAKADGKTLSAFIHWLIESGATLLRLATDRRE